MDENKTGERRENEELEPAMYSEYGEILEDDPPLIPGSKREQAEPDAAEPQTEPAEDEELPYSEYGMYADGPDPAEFMATHHSKFYPITDNAVYSSPSVPKEQAEDEAAAEQPADEPVDEQVDEAVFHSEAAEPADEVDEVDEADEAEQGNNAAPAKTYTPVKKVGRWSGGRVIGIVLGLVLAALLGFGGGLLAADRMSRSVMEEVEANFPRLLEEAGGAVLYRSVETQTPEGDAPTISVPAVTEACADAVVEISTEVPVTGWGLFGLTEGIGEGAGSGVIISDNGYILTCYHVVADAETITVGLRNGDSYEARLVASDEESDVAIIKIAPATNEKFTVAVLGDSSLLTVGEPVVAIGNPLGELGGSVTAGIISATDREVTIKGQGQYTVLQTDAAINGGNSGGGLFNAAGELIGLVNAKASSIGVEGLAFAIPVNDIQDIIEDLLNFGYVTGRSATLGVMMVDIMDERTATSYRVEELGCYILKVNEGSNAEYAGLQSGDLLVSIDGKPIDKGDTVVDIIAGHVVDDVIQVVVKRDGRIMEYSVTLYGALPSGSGAV